MAGLTAGDTSWGACSSRSSFRPSSTAPIGRMMLASFGKMPTTSERLDLLVQALEWVRVVQLRAVLRKLMYPRPPGWTVIRCASVITGAASNCPTVQKCCFAFERWPRRRDLSDRRSPLGRASRRQARRRSGEAFLGMISRRLDELPLLASEVSCPEGPEVSLGPLEMDGLFETTTEMALPSSRNSGKFRRIIFAASASGPSDNAKP